MRLAQKVDLHKQKDFKFTLKQQLTKSDTSNKRYLLANNGLFKKRLHKFKSV